MQKISRITALLIGILITGLLFTGCEKEETPISGGSSLKIINNCTYSVSIYFDNDFIGKVEEDANRTWSVPTGQHEVRASSYIGGTTKENPTFYAGQTVVITLSSGIKNSAADAAILMNIEQKKEDIPNNIY